MDVVGQVQQAVDNVFGGRRVVLAGGVLAGQGPHIERTAAGLPARPGSCSSRRDRYRRTPARRRSRNRSPRTSTGDGGATRAVSIRGAALRRPARRARRSDSPLRRRHAAVARTALRRRYRVRGRTRRSVIGVPHGSLEDKTVCDALFDEAGVPRPLSTIAHATASELVALHARFDDGAGTVWAGDAREGFNGGGEFVRWVRDDTTQAAALAFFAGHCDRVRVSPFVEGIPASVHGVVTTDGVAAFRPVELVTLRAETERGLKFCGANTFFDPDDHDRATMRAAVEALGAVLRARVGYRGPFTIDGICGPRRMGRDRMQSARWRAQLRDPGRAGVVVRSRSRECSSRECSNVSTHAKLADRVVAAADARRRWGGAWTLAPDAGRQSRTQVIDLAGDAGGYRAALRRRTPRRHALARPLARGWVRALHSRARSHAAWPLAGRPRRGRVSLRRRRARNEPRRVDARAQPSRCRSTDVTFACIMSFAPGRWSIFTTTLTRGAYRARPRRRSA